MTDKRNVIKATAVVTIFALAGKALGFIREMIIADKFGTTFRSDAYFIGLAGPDFIGNVIIGSVLVVVFIPMYASYLHNNDEKQTVKLLNNTASVLLLVLSVIILAGIPLAPVLVKLIAPEMEGDSFRIAVQVSRIVFPAMLFTGFSNLYGPLLNVYKHFSTPSMSQLIQNLFIIIAAVLLCRFMGVSGLAVGFLVGAIAQFAVMLPAMRRNSLGFSFDLALSPGFIKMLRLWVPLFFVGIVSAANDLVNRSLAAGLDVGSVSAINFSNRIRETTFLLAAVPLATAVFPLMSEYVAKKNHTELAGIIRFALRLTTFVAFPMCLAMLIYSHDIVRILFQRGMFNTNSTDITSTALIYYSAGALFMGLNYVVIRLYYSFQDSRTPLIAFSAAFLVNLVLGLVLRKYLLVGGIALARSIADMLTFVILALLLKRFITDFSQKDYWMYFLKIGAIGLISISLSRFVYVHFPVPAGILLQSALLGAGMAIAVLVYIIFCKALKIDEAEKIIQILRSKLAPSNV